CCPAPVFSRNPTIPSYPRSLRRFTILSKQKAPQTLLRLLPLSHRGFPVSIGFSQFVLFFAQAQRCCRARPEKRQGVQGVKTPCNNNVLLNSLPPRSAQDGVERAEAAVALVGGSQGGDVGA